MLHRRMALYFVAIVISASTGSAADSTKHPVRGTHADQAAATLVKSVLQLELKGDDKYRDMILQAAIEESPHFGPAHWHSGRVNVGEEWVEVKQYDITSEKLAASYAAKRDRAMGKPQQEYDLAIWCGRSGMKDRKQLHLMRVALLPGADDVLRARAIARLRLRNVGGRLLTPTQLTDLQSQQKEYREAQRKWLPQAAKWLRAYTSKHERTRQRVLDQIVAVDDSTAIATLEMVVSPVDEPLAGSVVAALKAMPTPAATGSLARHAIGVPWQSVSAEAIRELKRRPMHEYVPMLMGALDSPVQTVFQIQTRADGSVQYQHIIKQEGPDNDRMHQNIFALLPPGLPSDEEDWQEETRIRQMAAIGEIVQQIRNTETNLAANNRRINATNETIFAVLKATTGAAGPDSARDWWDWWVDYNGVELGQRPLQYTYAYQERFQPEPPPSRRTPATSGGRCECFPAGTPVWTELGSRPIDQIRVGDRVLSQDQDSGELAYKVVVNTTLREPSPMLKLTIQGSSINTTVGHPFWKSGHGWQLARLLEAGDRVRTTNGSQTVEKIEKVPELEAYNLIVDDFATYFVGSSGVLVHDNSYRSPTRAVLPGTIP